MSCTTCFVSIILLEFHNSSLKGRFNGPLLHLGKLRFILNTFSNVKRLQHEPFGEALLCRTKKVLAKHHSISEGNSLSRKKKNRNYQSFICTIDRVYETKTMPLWPS